MRDARHAINKRCACFIVCVTFLELAVNNSIAVVAFGILHWQNDTMQLTLNSLVADRVCVISLTQTNHYA